MDNLHSTCYVLILVVGLFIGFLLGVIWADHKEL